jgi:hypothetical protein
VCKAWGVHPSEKENVMESAPKSRTLEQFVESLKMGDSVGHLNLTLVPLAGGDLPAQRVRRPAAQPRDIETLYRLIGPSPSPRFM